MKIDEHLDFIGDIHGQAAVLRDLLARLDYREAGGCYHHPRGRRVVFLGDYIDRGPAIRETLQIVRAMVEQGSAIALCGNHEMNAMMHDTPDGRGGWLRPHGGTNTEMHARTHAEFADHEDEWREWLRWFQTLPIYLDYPGFRAVHACWDERAINVLGSQNRLSDDLLRTVADDRTAEAQAVSTLLKGPDLPLPTGYFVRGREGRKYAQMRIRWWYDGRGRTYRQACIHRHEEGPEICVPQDLEHLLIPPSQDPRPVFFGHYWLPPGRPVPIATNVTCLDYSVAAGGPLVAYCWDGERALAAEKFVYDPDRLPAALPQMELVA